MSNRTNGKLVIGVLLLGMFLVNATFAGADPTYEDITVDPAEPERQSDVNFSVEITGNNITEVYLTVEECMDTDQGEQCALDKLNVSMTNTTDTTWTCTATLAWEFTTIGHCWLVIKSDGEWFDFQQDTSKWTDFTVVSAEDGGDGNGADGGDGTDDTDGGTPGFELILVMISLLVAASLYKRKRMK
jgi:hypothetical protein